MNEHFATTWEAIADAYPGDPAIIYGTRVRTWCEFDDRASRLAGAFRDAGVQPGETVAIDLYNCSEYLEIFFAALKIRAVPANVNYRYLDDEMRDLLRRPRPGSWCITRRFADRVGPRSPRWPACASSSRLTTWAARTRQPDAETVGYEALIAGTRAGSRDRTSRQRRLPVVHRRHDRTAEGGRVRHRPLGQQHRRARPAESRTSPTWTGPRRRSSGPASSGKRSAPGGASGFADDAQHRSDHGVAAGAHARRHRHFADVPHFDADELFTAVDRHRPCTVSIVGDAFARPMLRALDRQAATGAPYDASSLITITSAGVAWSGQVKEQLLEHIPQVTLVDACGSTEGATIGSQVTGAASPRAPTVFVPGAGLRLLRPDGSVIPPDSREIGLFLLPTGGRGYRNDPERTARAFRTIDGQRYVLPGDWGRWNDDGTVTLVGRRTSTINTGGEKVFPEEVQQVVLLHEDVEDCLVLGVPDERFGQRVVAIVQPIAGRTVEPDEVTRFVHNRLAGYKAPRTVIVATVPRGPNGKALFKEARAMFEDSPLPRLGHTEQVQAVVAQEGAASVVAERRHLGVEVRRLPQALGVRPVRPHDQALRAAEAPGELDGVVLGVGHHADVLAGRWCSGRSLSCPPSHGPLRPMPRLLSMCRMKCGTHSAPNSLTSTWMFG